MNTKSLWQLFTFAVLATLISIGSCKKNAASEPKPTPPAEPPPATVPHQSPPVEYVSTTVTGRVSDQHDQPVSNAEIHTAFGSTTTDVNGQFILSNIQLDKYAAYIVAKKAGYFNGSRTFTLSGNSSNYIEIKLIQKNLSGQFSAASGANITIGNDGSINFPANSIVDSATSSIYSGIVSVFAYYLNPSSTDFLGLMPGELLGISKDSSEKVLHSYGMVVVELTGSSGQRLAIGSGKTATINFAIPPSLIPSAPAKIPLWYFDEIKGLWREQDSASLQENNYVANVSHFSFWSFDTAFPLVNFELSVVDNQNNPLSAVRVDITAPNVNFLSFNYSFTNADGKVTGPIPANTNLTLSIFDRCGNLAYSKNFTTTNDDVNLGTVQANAQTIPITFSGTFTDCLGTPIINGNVSIFVDGFFTNGFVNNGNFSITVNRCYGTPATAQLMASDLSSNLIDSLSINVMNANLGSLQLAACDQTSDQFLYYTLKGANDTLTAPDYAFLFRIDYYFVITAIRNDNHADQFNIYFTDTTAIGSPQTSVLIALTNYDSSYSTNTLTLTEFSSSSGGHIAGNFSGEVSDPSNGFRLTPISGRFRIKR